MTKREFKEKLEKILEINGIKYTEQAESDFSIDNDHRRIRFSLYDLSVSISCDYRIDKYRAVQISAMHLYYEEIRGIRIHDGSLFINPQSGKHELASFLTVDLKG